MMQALTPDDVQHALDQFDFGLKVQFFEESTATSQEAADAIGTALGTIVKSLCFMVESQPVIVLAAGDRRVDDRKLAAIYNVSRKKVKVATPEQCVEVFGYAPGSVPPLAHRTPDLPVYIEDSLARFTQLYAAAGAPNAIFPVELTQLQQITGGQLADLQREG
ncbi:MAG: YbaK/EbsC family protein [Anaerolineae bacterium]|nr:YbaK/EbsC family protein [Anaerolineae bacterium]